MNNNKLVLSFFYNSFLNSSLSVFDDSSEVLGLCQDSEIKQYEKC